MDHALVVVSRHLAESEGRVAQARQCVDRQREIVRKLEGGPNDPRQARSLLLQFEEVLALHIAYRDRCLRELAEISSYKTSESRLA